MRNKFGAACMGIGALLVLAALSLFLHNQLEARRAGASVDLILPQVMAHISQEPEDAPQEAVPIPAATATPEPSKAPPASVDASTAQIPDSTQDSTQGSTFDPAMTEVEIDGYGYIGCLTIPALDLELPVMAQWDYTRLKIAPCRYAGSTKTDNLVIAAHNYVRHFGSLSKLAPGDVVYFLDMDGVLSSYEVVEVDILTPTAVEEMTAGDYDLTLFTCTYGSRSRVTVRCDRISG